MTWHAPINLDWSHAWVNGFYGPAGPEGDSERVTSYRGTIAYQLAWALEDFRPVPPGIGGNTSEVISLESDETVATSSDSRGLSDRFPRESFPIWLL